MINLDDRFSALNKDVGANLNECRQIFARRRGQMGLLLLFATGIIAAIIFWRPSIFMKAYVLVCGAGYLFALVSNVVSMLRIRNCLRHARTGLDQMEAILLGMEDGDEQSR